MNKNDSHTGMVFQSVYGFGAMGSLREWNRIWTVRLRLGRRLLLLKPVSHLFDGYVSAWVKAMSCVTSLAGALGMRSGRSLMAF